jgi:hypothetical protein
MDEHVMLRSGNLGSYILQLEWGQTRDIMNEMRRQQTLKQEPGKSTICVKILQRRVVESRTTYVIFVPQAGRSAVIYAYG